MCGTICVLLYQFLLDRHLALILMGGFLSVFLTLEITRRFSDSWNEFLVHKVFGIIARPHERTKTNGATYFLVSMFLLVLMFPQKPVVQLAVLVLAFADPAASVFGKLWGRRKLFKDKSFLGTSAFLVVAFAVVLGFLTLAVPAFGFPKALLVATVVAVFATVTELFSIRIDDNLSIPIVSALAAAPFF